MNKKTGFTDPFDYIDNSPGTTPIIEKVNNVLFVMGSMVTIAIIAASLIIGFMGNRFL